MPSFSATTPKINFKRSKRIAVLVLDGFMSVDLAGPADAFSIAGQEIGIEGAYVLTCVSAKGGMISAASGLAVPTIPFANSDPSTIDTMIVLAGNQVGTWVVKNTTDIKFLTKWLKIIAERAPRMCALSGGVFLLAKAGLLSGRRATTHGTLSDQFRSLFPDVHLESDSIFVEDGKFWTSAGASASVDLALAFIRQDLGARVALTVAKKMVVFLQRPGGQAQFSAPLIAQCPKTSDNGIFAELMAHVVGNLTSDLSNAALAQKANMSPRSFARAFSERPDGLTPAKLVELARLEAACLALSNTDDLIKKIADENGFGDEERMRRAFIRQLAVTPNDYRARFRIKSI
jgi:transcriptional regulator GlxA family with amidase domain